MLQRAILRWLYVPGGPMHRAGVRIFCETFEVAQSVAEDVSEVSGASDAEEPDECSDAGSVSDEQAVCEFDHRARLPALNTLKL